MTATLSPVEAAEVTRFGIHDDDVLTDMEERFDEPVLCIACDKTATVRVLCRFCSAFVATCCRPCLDECKRRFRKSRSHCSRCGHHSTGFPEAIVEVPL